MPHSYKARSLKGAQARVRNLMQKLHNLDELTRRYIRERNVMAKLAAECPAFYNSLEVYEAKNLRNEILAHACNMKPDGSPLKT